MIDNRPAPISSTTPYACGVIRRSLVGRPPSSTPIANGSQTWAMKTRDNALGRKSRDGERATSQRVGRNPCRIAKRISARTSNFAANFMRGILSGRNPLGSYDVLIQEDLRANTLVGARDWDNER